MNVQHRIPQSTEVEMSPDGEVLIPAALRQAAGLIPNMPVVIGLNDRNEVVLMTRTRAKRIGETREQRRVRIRAALDAAGSGAYSTGQTTEEVMDELRGDRPL